VVTDHRKAGVIEGGGGGVLLTVRSVLRDDHRRGAGSGDLGERVLACVRHDDVGRSQRRPRVGPPLLWCPARPRLPT
jgi:hypothetical protein